jgi:predicted RNA binding protein YcfA (HicA-like mRNA interferase family)
MTKLPLISSKVVIKALRAAGFEDAPKRGKGSQRLTE